MRGIMTTALLGAFLMATAVASPAIASENDRKGATLKESRMASKAERF